MADFWGNFVSGIKRTGRAIGHLVGIDAEPSTITLDDRIDGSSYILSYVARKKIDLDPQTIRQMIVAQHAKANKLPMSLDQECDFWFAYMKATTIIAPVTVDSLKASGNYRRSGTELVRIPAGRSFRWLTGLVLISLLTAQVYWLNGHGLMLEVDRLEAKISSALVQFAIDRKASPPLDGSNVVLSAKPGNRTASSRYCINSTGTSDNEKVIVQRSIIHDVVQLPKNAAPPSDFDLEAKCIMAHLVHLWRVYDHLYNWTYPHNALSFVWPSSNKKRGELPDWHVAMLDVKASTNDAARATYVEGSNATFAATARLKLEILSKYLLPLLYGLLGACAFVLRDITREVHAETYTRNANVGYSLRIVLGLVAGLSVAWFVQPTETGSILATISPLALSFVAGYSVDLLFTAIDRIIGAFSTRTDGRPAVSESTART